MAEKSFADYVKDVMSVLPSVDRSNMLAPTTMSAEEVAAYRANPFYKQEEIRQRIAAEEAAKTPTTPISQGMMADGGDSGGQDQPINPYVAAFLEAETPQERANRIQNDLFGLKPIGAFMLGGTAGLGGLLSGQPVTPALSAQRAMQYQNTPNWLKDMFPGTFGVGSPYADAARAQEYQNNLQDILSRTGFSPDGSTYTSSYGGTYDTSGISAAEQAGLESARDTYGYGSDANYFGD